MNDEWISAALTDDTVVVDILIRLRQPPSKTPLPTTTPSTLLPPVRWGLRQRRTKPVTLHRKDAATTTATRFSPTTPLSWSGGAASPSDGGYDASSRPSSDPSSSSARSEGAFNNELVSVSSSSRFKRKKTFAELREEESLLLKERVNLRKELDSVHMTLTEQRARRQNLKQIKFDLNLHSSESVATTTSKQPEQAAVSSSGNLHLVLESQTTTNDNNPASSSLSCKSETGRGGFVLPDLNMMPSEEEITSDFS